MNTNESISINGQFITINEKIKIDLKFNVEASLIWNDSIFVVLDYRKYKPANENVHCYGFDGVLKWTIEPGSWPEDRDCPVTGISIRGNKLSTYRWCGFRQEIDHKTGKEISVEFTK